jgi:hypothetical protein
VTIVGLPSHHWRLFLGIGLIGCAAYACLDTQPLYAENQNTKFLYGLAKAGVGRLKDDWLIGQGSQLPIFDAFVYLTQAFAGGWFFYVWHLAMLIAYAAALYGFARVVGLTDPERLGPNGRWFLPIFGAWFIFMNTRHITLKALFGVANQHINSHTFEPQSFGVLALLGLLLFRLGETGWAVVLVVAAAWIHPPYSIAGLMILSGFLVARWRFGSSVDAPLPVIAGGVIGCLGAAAFTYSLMQPSDPAVQAEALRIITEVRIPGHSWPAIWFEDDAIIKSAVLLLVLWLIRRDPLGWVLATMAATIVALTLWVHFAHDAALALAAPWRASTIVVPAAGAVLFGRIVQWIANWTSGHPRLRYIGIGAACLLLLLGVERGIRNRIEFFQEIRAEPRYYAWVRENAREGDVFLTSLDDETFRLGTGQPQYVSWKTHPHRPESVLAWYKRAEEASAVADAERPACNALDSLAAEGVTYFIRQSSLSALTCPGWNVAYQDASVVILGK